MGFVSEKNLSLVGIDDHIKSTTMNINQFHPTNAHQKDLPKLPIPPLDFEVVEIEITGFPLENSIDLCMNGLCEHQVTRCKQRQSEADSVIFDLTKKTKHISLYRDLTKAKKGINVHKLDKMMLSVPGEFKKKLDKTCKVIYKGSDNQLVSVDYYPFNNFHLPWLEKSNEIKLTSSKPFDFILLKEQLKIFSGDSSFDKSKNEFTASIKMGEFDVTGFLNIAFFALNNDTFGPISININ